MHFHFNFLVKFDKYKDKIQDFQYIVMQHDYVFQISCCVILFFALKSDNCMVLGNQYQKLDLVFSEDEVSFEKAVNLCTTKHRGFIFNASNQQHGNILGNILWRKLFKQKGKNNKIDIVHILPKMLISLFFNHPSLISL